MKPRIAFVSNDCVQAYRDGYAAALHDAMNAIESREDGEYFPWVQVEIALAAIDSLKEKP